jgi:hypothetical protein
MYHDSSTSNYRLLNAPSRALSLRRWIIYRFHITSYNTDTDLDVIQKVIPQYWAGIRAATEEEKAEAADKIVAAVLKEVEPLLKNAAPFFGGSSTITLAEVSSFHVSHTS